MLVRCEIPNLFECNHVLLTIGGSSVVERSNPATLVKHKRRTLTGTGLML